MRRIGHALASLRWRLTLTFIALLLPLLVLLAGYQYLALRASLISNRVSEMQADFTSAKRLVANKERALGATTTAALRLCATRPALVGAAVASAVSAVTGQTVQVVVFNSSLAQEAVMPVGASPPTLDAAVLQGVVSRGTRSSAQQIATSSGDELVVAFPVVAGTGACGVAQLSVSMTPITSVLHDEILLITAGGLVILVLALVLGVLLTGRTLRPMRRLTATAEQLAAGDLTARSRLAPSSDEVGQLASSFDHMADRIQEAFAAQQDSEAKVRRFIADASHELRTPLTALKGYIDVLRRGAGREPAALDAALESMSAESERMRVLVLDLLTLARLDAQRESHPEDFDLAAAVNRLLDEGVPGMPPLVERSLGPASPVVRADRGAVSTIVRNLLVNACKYAHGAAQHWSTGVEGGWAKLELRDEGPGIPAADLPHVFERFYRGEKTRAREEGGSGLGLSIVQGLARAQGGDVAIRSADGAGTTVTVWLPLAPVPPPPPTG
ncbi:MAG TPA: HAMP domain-containing sensor histidine kinase [Candidatus Saccharimonadales bacterium]|nr:HAMP domain-containing sensor histidine kinase [Candidatus Saccharimonadales bacterium]